MNCSPFPGLRPDKILKLHQELGISSLAELEAAAKEDRIRKVKGLGASLQTKILQNLSIARSGETQLHLHKAAALLEACSRDRETASTRNIPASKSLATSAGAASWSRISRSSREAKRSFESSKASGGLKLAVTDKKHFGASLLHATGSAEHLEQLAKLAAATRVLISNPMGFIAAESWSRRHGGRYLRGAGSSVHRA